MRWGLLGVCLLTAARLMPTFAGTVPDEAVFSAAPLAVSGTISAPSTAGINPGTVLITVTDADANTTGGIDTIAAGVVTAVDNGCVACVPAGVPALTETAPNSGVFTVNYDFVAALGLTGGKVMRLTYNDANPTTNKPVAFVTITSTSGTLTVPATVSNGVNLLISVTDADANLNAGAIETIVGRVKAVKSGCGACSVATINVTETGNNTGIFTVSFDYTTIGLVTGDVIQVTYEDADPTSNKPTATSTIVSASGTVSAPATAAVNTANSGFTITVTDADANTNPAAPDAIPANRIKIVKEGCGACTVLNPLANLNETANNSGVFTVVYAFAPHNLIGGEILRITYEDASPVTNKPFVLVTITSTSGTLSAPATALIGDTVAITVVDADANVTAGANNDNLVGRVKAVKDNCPACTVQTIDLAESVTTAGTFTVAFNFAGLGLVSGDTMRVTYEDADPLANKPTTTIRVFDKAGTLSVPSLVSLGSNLLITVTDPQANTDINTKQTLTNLVEVVCVCSGLTPDYSPVETGNNTGIFTITVPVATIAADLGVVFAAGSTFDVIYHDADPVTNDPQVTVTVIGAGVDGSLVVSPTTVSAGGSFTVTVTDANLNQNAAVIETVTVTIQNISTGASPVNFTLTETGANTGVFTASVSVTAAGLNGVVGHTLRVTYVDSTPSSGDPKTLTANVVIASLVFGNNATLTVTDTIPGRAIQVTLTDPDLGSTASATITVQNTTINGTVETLVLGLVAGTSGQYSGSIATAFGTTPDGLVDGIVEVKDGDKVTFSYADGATSSGFAATVTAISNVGNRRSASAFCNSNTNTNNPAWYAEYFPNKTLTGGPAVVAEEFGMSVNWQETAPFRQLPADGWSARWTTSLTVNQFAKFRFRIGADDGVRFYIDDVLQLDQFVPGVFRTFTIDVPLAAGTHRFKVEYFEDNGNAGVLAECLFLEGTVAALDPEGNRVDVFPSDVNFNEAIAHITTGRINVRANPTVQAARIGYVYIYQRYHILGVTEDFGWYLIDLKDGRSGWVASRYVRRYENIPVQIYPVWASTETALPNVEVTGQATEELKIRTSPRTGTQIGLLPKGAVVRVLARNSSGSWYKITFEGLEGWVFAPYVRLTNGTVQDLPRQ